MKAFFEAYLSLFLEKLIDVNVRLKKIVGDAPERARLKCFKTHGGFFSCDLCLASAENLTTEGRRGSKEETQIYYEIIVHNSGIFCTCKVFTFFT